MGFGSADELGWTGGPGRGRKTHARTPDKQSTAELPRHAAAARARRNRVTILIGYRQNADIMAISFGRARDPTHPPGSETGDDVPASTLSALFP